VAGSVAVAALLCCSCSKTDGVIKRWSALSALVTRPHSTAQASNGRFVTAETAVHSQGSACGSCGEQSGIGTDFGSSLSQHSTTKPNWYVVRTQFGVIVSRPSTTKGVTVTSQVPVSLTYSRQHSLPLEIQRTKYPDVYTGTVRTAQ
jgi:hypothetical protein